MMTTKSSVLSFGRGAALILVGALLISWVAGWLRGHLLNGMTPLVLALPWLLARRVLVGLLFDLPAGLVTAAASLAAVRLIVIPPLTLVASLVGCVWVLDALVAWLVSGDLGLWTDPFAIVGRTAVLTTTLLGGARLAGWKPRRRPSTAATPSPADEDEGAGADERV